MSKAEKTRNRVERLRLLYGENCHWCGVVMRFTVYPQGCRRRAAIDATVEHIVPRHSGGTSDPTNLALAHALCNSSRHGGLPRANIEDDVAARVARWLWCERRRSGAARHPAPVCGVRVIAMPAEPLALRIAS